MKSQTLLIEKELQIKNLSFSCGYMLIEKFARRSSWAILVYKKEYPVYCRWL